MPNKTWVVGEEVLAADFNTYVQQQVIAGFATPAARTSGLPAPVRGQASYIAAAGPSEGLEFWDGVAWRKPWNQPWGLLGTISLGVQSTGWDTVVRDITGLALTVPTAPNRALKISFYALYGTTSAGQWVQLFITKSDNTQLQAAAGVPGAVSGSMTPFCMYNTGAGETSLSVKIRGQCGGGNFSINGASGPAYLTVEDVGPAAGAPAARADDDEP
jgi:hypothetical protein